MSSPEPTTEAQTNEKPHRRWLPVRWSMRVMIGFVTLLCGVLAWLGHIWHLGQVHDEVGTAIEMTYAEKIRNIGSTGVQWKLSEKLKLSFGTPGSIMTMQTTVRHVPPWMRVTSFDYFWQRIDTIHLHTDMQPKQMEVAVAQIPRLDHLCTLNIGGQDFPEEKLAAMVGSIRLDQLIATHASLGTGPMPWLRHTRLKELNLSYTQFSDAAVDDLPMTLERLELEETQITDDGVAKLTKLKRLKVLILRDTHVSKEAYLKLKEELPDCWIDWDPFETPEQIQQRRENQRRERRLEYERQQRISVKQN
ncbi:hypothetical protein C5Y96_07135 [Blastopirellula marina]|uniref:Leucine-rich repeat domain-containing protein n=1 Tax=Blastopirellula marina TaxID=124 RepID=A0A2S8FXN1_9BACT|nr:MULTISPECIES: hypothetical protein [Pirellulaceae]PQO36929.1 hypothetical protein C5Y96_07135 [Blastopirellula marina]RCS53644.1 hypothetical protein DTL36_07145 [Bremerella cremea]